MTMDHSSHHKHHLFHSDPTPDHDYSFCNTSDSSPANIIDRPHRYSSDYTTPSWDPSSPRSSVPLTDQSSPLSKSPWTCHSEPQTENNYSYTGLMGSLVREEGHIYSLAASGDLLYTGSDSKNIRVWKNQKEFSGFKSTSGLVKAIIIAGERIFTGHQDGKIRVWKISPKDPTIHKRIGTLPTIKACFKNSINPGNYSGKKRSTCSIKHTDAISSLSLSEDKVYLYSASWDKCVKVWRAADSKFLETINAHDDAVNSVVAGFDGLVFSGSADGTVKIWRRELQGKGTKHFFSQTLLKQECAVTALAVDDSGSVLYCGSSDGFVNFWEREKHLAHGGTLRGHKLAVLCLAAVGNLVISGSADTNICVWRRESEGNHVCLSVLNGHSGPVKCLAVEENKEGGGAAGESDRSWILYSGSLDKSVKIWRVSANQSAPGPTQPQYQPEMEAFPVLNAFSSRNSRVSQRRQY